MRKQKQSKLDGFAEQLDEMFTPVESGGAGLTLVEGREELAKLGCSVSPSRLGDWWSARQSAKQQAMLLGQIASGARACREVETQLGKNPAPELETLIKLHRVLVLKLSTQGNVDIGTLEMVGHMMKPVIEFAKLQEKQADRKLDERRVKLLEEKAATADKAKGLLEDKGLSQDEKAARMRELFGIA